MSSDMPPFARAPRDLWGAVAGSRSPPMSTHVLIPLVIQQQRASMDVPAA